MGDDNNVHEYRLKEDCELRFEVGNEDVSLELQEGRAEIFGTELELFKKYNFSPKSHVAVFTWKGALIELIGKTARPPYIAETTPMVVYLNTHAALEQLRQQAESSSHSVGDAAPRGPRIMLVGPTDVGKSTVCRILCNYAVRQGRSTIYIDLDVGQGSISVPGTIGALFVNKTADVIEGFDRSKPLVYNFGYTAPADNLPLYDLLVKELAEGVSERSKVKADARIGGMVINTCGWVNGEGYQCIVNAAMAFEVDVVVVIDHERLYNDLRADLPNFVKIVHQPKSGGVETRSREVRTESRNATTHRYFYGTRSHPFFPYTFDMAFSDAIFCKIGTEKLPDSCLPFGVKQEDHETKVVTIQLEASMRYHLFAVTPCPTVSQAIVKATILGYVHITEIDMEAKTFKVLSPQSQLPNKVLVYTDISFVDDQVNRQ